MNIFKKLFKAIFGDSRAVATTIFLRQIYNPHIRANVQNSESPRDAAILIVQDAFEIAGDGKVIGRIKDVVLEKGMYIVIYELFGEEGSISFAPNNFRGGYAY